MKFCINCGKQLEDNEKFCTSCGTRAAAPKATPVQEPKAPVNLDADKTVVELVKPAPVQQAPAQNQTPMQPYAPKYAAQVPQQPVYQSGYQPATAAPKAPVAPKVPNSPKAKKNNLPLVLGIAGVALVVVIAIVVLLLTGAFMGDRGKVMAAFSKTGAAYAEVAKDLNLDLEKYNELAESHEFNQSLSVKINSWPYYEELKGIGVRMDMSSSLPQKVMDMSVTPFVGSADVAEVQLRFEDDMLYLGAPEVVGDAVFAVNTETLGRDLYDMGLVYDEEVASLSINVFELAEIMLQYMPEKQELPLNEIKEILKDIEVEKEGKSTVEVNDKNIKATEYKMTIPKSVTKRLLKVLMEVNGEIPDVEALAKDLMKAIGAPDYAMEEIEIESVDVDEMVDEVVDTLGTIKTSVFVSKGYVVALEGDMTIEDTEVEYSIQLGGGDNYVDDLSIHLEAEDEKIVLTSTGDHAMKDGVFTDETVIKVAGEKIKLETTYDPKGQDENFELHMSAPDGIKLDIVGLIRADKDGLVMNYDKLSLTVEGETLNVALQYSVSDYEAGGMSTSGAMEVLKMSEEELAAKLEQVGTDVMAWAEKFAAENEELLEALEYMM